MSRERRELDPSNPRPNARNWFAFGSIQVFRKWCAAHDLLWMPASPADVRLFVRELLPQIGEFRVQALLRAVRRVHLLNDEPDPTQGAWLDDEDEATSPRRRKLVKRVDAVHEGKEMMDEHG